MKNIAIIYERELDIGGVETHLLSLFCRLDPQQFRFTVLAPVSSTYQQAIARLGVQIIPIKSYKPLNSGAFIKIRQILHQEQVDLVHAHSPTAAVPARLAARTLGLPAVVTVHIPAIDYHGVRRSLRASTGRRLYVFLDKVLNYNLTSRLIFVSDQIFSRSIQKHWAPAERSRIIPNGIDLSRFQTGSARKIQRHDLRQEFHLPDDLPLIVFIGRLSDQKGLDVLLRSLASLRQEEAFASEVRFRAWIIGAGPLVGELKAQAEDCGLTSQVSFLGPRANISACLAAADIFVLPSRWEAMSISLIEAIASGLPCLVTDVGENARLIENGVQGIVIAPDDPAALYTGLRRLIVDPELRFQMGQAALQKSGQYSDLEMARQVQAIYQEALSLPF